MFDNNRLKFAAIGGGIILAIVIISQLPPEFVNKFVPWLFSSAVLVGGSRYWWSLKKQLDLRYPQTKLTPDAALYEKFLNEFSNHILAFAAVAVTCFFIIMAGRTTLYFFGKTTLATAQDAGVILTQKIAETANGATSAVGSGIQYMVSAGSSFDPQIEPEKLDYRKEYSLFGGASTSGGTSYSAPAYTAPQSAAPVQNASTEAVPESAEPEQQSAAPAEQQVAELQTAEYRVQPGDTLAQLAKRYYGDADLWPVICAANAANLPGGCSNINSNQRLVIPAMTADANVDLKQLTQTAMTQVNQAVASGAMASNGLSQAPAQALASSVPAGWSTVNSIVTRDDYNLAVQNSSQAGLPAQPAQEGSAVASWSVVKP